MENTENNDKPPSHNGTNFKAFPNEKIVQRVIEDEMKQAYLEYSMSVIVGRALPDARDGLKPVHRRVLFAMHELGLASNKPFRKCARIIGEVLGKFHPHGDSAVYDTLVRMAQPFSLRYPLVNGQGNFGSIDGDHPAAMRYTEAKLQKISEDMLEDIDKETVNFKDNFDASLKEPTILPAKIPNLLINGSSGIAVGMATNIPPHNLGEIIEGVIKIIDYPEITMDDLMLIIKGPDFPTGGIICGHQGIQNAFSHGRGRIIVRGRSEIEEKNNKTKIILTEVPYMVNKAVLVEQIASLVRDKKLEGISDLRDESNKDGIRIVLELKQNTNSEIVLNQLYKHSRFQVTFGVNTLALVENIPRVLNLKQLIEQFIYHRKEVVTRRTKFELKKAQERLHILDGLIIALDHIDEIIKKIKASTDVPTATQMLLNDYKLSDLQAKSILDMRLQKLANLEQIKIRDEHTKLLEIIQKLKKILSDEFEILNIIKKELKEIKERYNDERRTEISDIELDDTRFDMENLIEEEDVVITITHAGYIKRTPVTLYKEQKRGGRGSTGTGRKEEDFVENIFTCSTHSNILFFTSKGKVYWLKAYNIPEGSRQARGKAVVNLINFGADEFVSAIVPVKEFDYSHFLLIGTRQGMIKKTNLIEFSRPRQGGIIAIGLEEGDEMINAILTDGSREIMLATENGMSIRFNELDVRPMGRPAKGVKGINLKTSDRVVDMIIVSDDKSVLTITENGYGKRTLVQDYRKINRGGTGVINIQTTERNGKVIGVKSIYEDNDVILISKLGVIIRTNSGGIPVIGRNTQGVKIMKLDVGDKVVASAKIINDKDPEKEPEKE